MHAGRLVDRPGGDHPVGDHGPLAVRVAQERLQRADPLHQAVLQELPVLRGDDPRHDVEGEEPVLLAVEVEGHAESPLDLVAPVLTLAQPGGADPVERGQDEAVRPAGAAVEDDRLVAGGVVAGQHHGDLLALRAGPRHPADGGLGLGDEQVHDLGQAAPRERLALTGRRAAAFEDGLGQGSGVRGSAGARTDGRRSRSFRRR
jgi:hypothetical protein